MPVHDPVYKVTIIPRGRALGVTMFLPEKDRYSMSKERIECQISSLFGGRIAEALIFGPDCITTGASNDIQRATELARNMVTQWGLSDNLGPVTYGEDQGEIFLGQSMVMRHKELADDTAKQIDKEIRMIIDRNYKRAEKVLKDHRDILEAMSKALMKYETLDNDQLDDLMVGKDPKPPADWHDDNNHDETESEESKEMPGHDEKQSSIKDHKD